MVSREQIHPDMIVGDVLRKWPQTAIVFWRYRTACIGCAFESFCTLAYLATEYDLNIDALTAELADVIGSER
jgi:hybrid cluster-associated redox disulfide protein